MLQKTQLLLFLLLTASCARFPLVDSSNLTPRNTLSSVISTPTTIYAENAKLVTIETVDARIVRFLDNQIVVAPGLHTFGVKVEMAYDSEKKKERRFTTKASSDLTFEVLSGIDYVIDATEDEKGLWIWVENAKTKEVTAGSKP